MRRSKTFRVAYLVTHPIQYQAPMLRRLNADPDLEVTALFRSDFSVRGYVDEGFGAKVIWDVPLLEGYPHRFLPAFGTNDRLTVWRPWTHGLLRELRRGRYDALWVHGYGPPHHLWALLLGRLCGMRVMLRDEAHNRSRTRGRADRFKARLVFTYLKAVVHRFLAIGTANRERYLSQGVDPAAIHLVPYAVDNRYFGIEGMAQKHDAKRKVAGDLGFDARQPIILFAAKLQRRKRCSDLVRAFLVDGVWNHPSRPVLVVAGDGEEMAACRALAEASPGGSAIRFLGFQNQSQLAGLYRAADIFVLVSQDEAWGLTINEAMSAGCAVLASEELGSAADLVRNGENGFACAAGDPDVQARLLLRLLDDPDMIAQMGRASLERMQTWSFEEDVVGLRQALGLPADPVRLAEDA